MLIVHGSSTRSERELEIEYNKFANGAAAALLRMETMSVGQNRTCTRSPIEVNGKIRERLATPTCADRALYTSSLSGS